MRRPVLIVLDMLNDFCEGTVRKESSVRAERGLSSPLLVFPREWCLLILLIPAIRAPQFACAQSAQTQEDTLTLAATKPKPSYEVATIRQAKSGDGSWKNTADGFSIRGASASILIRNAYGIVMPQQIVGLPNWASSEPLDLEAKMDFETIAAVQKLPPMEQWRQRQLMFQSLLAERFSLKIHHISKPMSVYALTVAKGGSKLKTSSAR